MKKIAIILCLTLLVSVHISVSASERSAERLSKLYDYGIFQGDETGELNLDSNITRAEFCKMVAVMLNMEEENPINTNNYFADVPAEHWAYQYVMFCYNQGLVNGVYQPEKLYFVDLDENGNEIGRSESFFIDNFNEVYGTNAIIPESLFAPDDNITYQDALKILVCALGYGDITGNYPYGYINKAKEIGIINTGFSNTDYLSRESATEIVYNSLFVPLLIISDINDVRVEYVIADGSGDTQLQTLYKKYFEN